MELEQIRRRGVDENGVLEHARNVQHKNGSVKRQVSSQDGFHADGQERRDREDHCLQ